ncbi:MAG: CRISPR-associated protein Cas4 [Actinomycetota bacterium]|nr:CRISPR-associated protein Cas4 [Actinomycetota bacterium]
MSPSPATWRDEDIVTLSEVEHFAYCERQWALISIERKWSDNLMTVQGASSHRRVDEPSVRVEHGDRVLRGLTVWSDRYGLYGRADIVELPAAGSPRPVEYKRGGSKGLAAARLQLTAQALCLEEMLTCAIPEGVLWLDRARRRVTVPIDADLRHGLLPLLASLREARKSAYLPAASYDRRCPSCSLINECLPQLVSDRRRVSTIHAMLFAARGVSGA